MGKKNKNKLSEAYEISMDLLFKLDDEPNEINTRIAAEEIKRKIQQGASVDNISGYKHNILKNTLSYYRVSGRSRLTYKEDMAKRLVEVFGHGIDGHGKKSKDVEKKKEATSYDDITNTIIRHIKRTGGL